MFRKFNGNALHCYGQDVIANRVVMGSIIRPQSPIFCISFDSFAMWISGLPLASLLACVAFSILWHFDETTRTHCKVSRGFLDLLRDIGALLQNISSPLEKKSFTTVYRFSI